jgi:ABC-type multidrug transport system fused ATPase/permease subunit
MILIVSILLIVLLLSSFLVIYLYKRNKLKRKQLNAFKQQLNNKQEFVSQGLTKKIEDTKTLQAEERKNASVDEREKLDKELYNGALHLNNWDLFNSEMNHAFNNIIVSLKVVYPAITRKEIIWSCLHLLDVPHADRILLLDATSDSLYKLKQRLAHKLNLKSTKELDTYLRNLTEIKG